MENNGKETTLLPKVDLTADEMLALDLSLENDLSLTLFNAVNKQDIETVKLTVKNPKCDVNKFFAYKIPGLECRVSPLMLAAFKGNLDIVNELLRSESCKINLRSTHFQTALIIAAQEGFLDVTRALIHDPRTDVNSRTAQDENALCIAAKNKRPAIVKLLLEDGRFDVNEKDGIKRTPLFNATEAGNVESVNLLLAEKRCDVNVVSRFGDTALHMASEYAASDPRKSRKDILEAHVRQQPNVHFNAEDNPLVLFMQRIGNVSAYKMSDYYYQCIDLITNVGGILSSIPFILAFAIEYSTTEICALLIRKGASVDSCFPGEESAIFCALRNNSFSKCKLLVENGADLNIKWRDMTPFQFAVAFSCLPEIITLLSQSLEADTIRKTFKQFSFVNESSLDCAARLGVLSLVVPDQLKANENTTQTSLKTNSFKMSKICSCRIPTKRKNIPPDIILKIIATSPTCNFHMESKRIETELKRLLLTLSSKLRQAKGTKHLHFRTIIAGSMAEGTKTFQTDEFDVVCEFVDLTSLKMETSKDGVTIKVASNSPWKENADAKGNLIVSKVSHFFYSALRKLIKNMTSNKKHAAKLFGNLHLHAESLEIKEKVSRLQLMWNGDYFKNMVVHVDLVAAFPLDYQCDADFAHRGGPSETYHAIAKKSRRKIGIHSAIYGASTFPFSNKVKDAEELLSIPENQRLGYVYAKSMRIAEISQPENPEELLLSGSVDTEDCITSFLLKQCLFDRQLPWHFNHPTVELGTTPFCWAERIYSLCEHFITGGRAGINTVGGSVEYIIRCKHNEEHELVAECCHKKRVMLRVCRRIREWLRANSRKLRRLMNGKHLVYSRYENDQSYPWLIEKSNFWSFANKTSP